MHSVKESEYLPPRLVLAKKQRSKVCPRGGNRRPSIDELIDQCVAETILRGPKNVVSGNGDLRAQGPEVLDVKLTDSRGGLSATDLKYEMLDNKGQRVNSDGVTQWLQVGRVSDNES